MRRAATHALARLRPGRVGFGLRPLRSQREPGACPPAEGSVVRRQRGRGVTAVSVAVVSVDDLAGRPIALLVSLRRAVLRRA